MSLTFAILSIIVITCLMILAMLLRAKSRERTKYIGLSFCHEGACWKMAIRKAQFWQVLYISTKIHQADLLSFCPQISYKVMKNSKALMSLPNFWTNSAGIVLRKVAEADNLVIQIEVVFKDLPMAQAFVTKLLEEGYDADKISMQHNKIVFTADL